ILTTSFVILIILGFSFWFLIRTILRQKTLEEMKSDFTNNITHELKTPIAVAYAANDALLNFNLAEDKQQRDKYLGICQEQLQRLSGLVEQILSMSMERRKTFRLHPETLSLHDLFPTLIEQHKLKAGKPVEINLDIAPEDLTIIADRTHFSNILSNLIDNAIKYSPDKADIMICCRKKETEQVEISVTDHGIGIPTDKQPHIFDKFYRVPTGNIHNTKGYGLGLFYVKTMVEKHGGMVTVRSEAGKGSTFTIRI
ncbi:sensor histidine kinase, partial [Bacteroides cellulosilyticus]